MECCVGVSTETVLQIDKFYIVVRRILKLTFWTVVGRRTTVRTNYSYSNKLSIRKVDNYISIGHTEKWKKKYVIMFLFPNIY